MRAVVEILQELPDDESRARVVQWCHEQFVFPVRPSSPRPQAPGADDRQRPAGPSGGHEEPDPALTIGEDVFDAPPRKRHPVHYDDSVGDALGDIALGPIHYDDSVDDVSGEPMQYDDSVDLFDGEPICDDDLAVNGFGPVNREPEPQRPATTGFGLESALRDFVADFQRLALAFA